MGSMDMDNLPGNSNKDKENRPKLEKIVTGTATLKEKTLGDKLKRIFWGPQFKTALIFVGGSVILPAIKDMAEDAITSMIRGSFNGGDYGRGPRRGVSGGNSNYVNYSSFSKQKPEERREISAKARASHDFGEVILGSRAEADMILESLQHLIDQYGHAKVSDMYDLADITGSFADTMWGWYDLRGAAVRRSGGGYHLAMPRTQPIE